MTKRIPDPRQISELFNILSEEGLEVAQVISKINRFGLYSCHPDTPGVTNMDRLVEEVGDFIGVAELLTNAGYLSAEGLAVAAEKKKKKVAKWSSIRLEDFE
jgi:NTP pyrophosphatase (non-canonical NTP hydrolase)